MVIKNTEIFPSKTAKNGGRQFRRVTNLLACARCPTYSRPSGSVVSTAECPLKLYAQLTHSISV